MSSKHLLPAGKFLKGSQLPKQRLFHFMYCLPCFMGFHGVYPVYRLFRPPDGSHPNSVADWRQPHHLAALREQSCFVEALRYLCVADALADRMWFGHGARFESSQ